MTLQKALRTAQNYFPGGRDGREAISRRLRRWRRQPHEMDFTALRWFPPRRLLLDVGANYGQSIASMRLMQRESPIIAFEPNGDLAGKITQLFQTEQNVTIHAFGLSDKAGMFDLFVPFYRGFPYPGLASLDHQEAYGWLSSETLYWFRPAHLEVRHLRCRIETLDSQKLSPYFIKIDVQGAEFAVLTGGHATLAQHHPILLIENPDRDPRIAQLLTALGYSAYSYVDGGFVTHSTTNENRFFMTDARAHELRHATHG